MPTTSRLTRLSLLGLCLSLAAGCDRGPTDAPPEPATLLVTLVSPHGAEGAAVVELQGAAVDSITPDAGTLFVERQGEVARVVVIAPVAGELRFRVHLSDSRRPPTATVVEVADAEDRPRNSLAGYSVRLAAT